MLSLNSSGLTGSDEGNIRNRSFGKIFSSTTINDVMAFYLLIVLTIGINYYSPGIIKYFFYLALLYSYYKSNNEPFWLAFFLAISDGVFGFLGKFEASMEVVPGLPSIEVAQFYVLLSILKARRVVSFKRPFISGFLVVMAIYIIFLIAQGYTVGLSSAINVQLRLIKRILPLLLFYSIPRLFQKESQYLDTFRYLFPIAILSLGAQIFTILKSTSTMDYFGAKEEYRHKILINLGVDKENTYRGIYNEYILLIAYLGALYAMAIKTLRFSKGYLYLVIAAIFFSYFLSATRGYVLGFTLIFVAFFVFVLKLNLSRIIPLILATLLTFGLVQTLPIIKVQLTNAFERMLTLEALVGGDVTAGGTLKRIHVRGPRVIKKWAESPLTGWGFSDTFTRHSDMHVANQNLLLHSGIIGGLLMLSFFIYFNAKLWIRSMILPKGHPYKQVLLVFVIFFMGWFTIHSSTQYYFSYYVQCSGVGILLVTFFSFASLVYDKSMESSKDIVQSA